MASRKPILQVVDIQFNGIFPFTASVVYKRGSTIEQAIKEASLQYESLIELANDDDGTNPALSLVYKANGTTNAFIFVDDEITIDTLVHEAIHLSCRLFEIIGSKVTDDTEEVFSYLNTHIFKEVYKVITTIFKLKPKMIYGE